MYQKWSSDVILGNSGRYCSVYKLQDKTEHNLVKATVVSSVSHFNLRVEILFGGLSRKKPPRDHGTEFWVPVSLGGKMSDICLIRIIAYSGWTHTKNLGKLVMPLTWFVCTNSRNHWKTLREIFETRQKQKLKIKRIPISEIQDNRGPIFLHFACQGGRRALLPSPVSYAALVWASSFIHC